MRWSQRKVGDRRSRSGFLFFPRLAGREWRWLERAHWMEERRESVRGGFYWNTVTWID